MISIKKVLFVYLFNLNCKFFACIVFRFCKVNVYKAKKSSQVITIKKNV